MKKRLAEIFEHDVAFEEEEEAIDDSYIMKEDWIQVENIYEQKQSYDKNLLRLLIKCNMFYPTLYNQFIKVSHGRRT